VNNEKGSFCLLQTEATVVALSLKDSSPDPTQVLIISDTMKDALRLPDGKTGAYVLEREVRSNL
jgi:hypothetical protein